MLLGRPVYLSHGCPTPSQHFLWARAEDLVEESLSLWICPLDRVVKETTSIRMGSLYPSLKVQEAACVVEAEIWVQDQNLLLSILSQYSQSFPFAVYWAFIHNLSSTVPDTADTTNTTITAPAVLVLLLRLWWLRIFSLCRGENCWQWDTFEANTDKIHNSLLRQCGEHWHLRWWLLIREVVLVWMLRRCWKGSWTFEISVEKSSLYISKPDVIALVVSVDRERVKVQVWALGCQCLGLGRGEAATWTPLNPRHQTLTFLPFNL